MKRGVPILALVALASSAGLVAPAAAYAQDCYSRILIYSRTGVLSPVSTAPTGYLNIQPDANKDIFCANGFQEPSYDPRIIAPGANMVMVRIFGSHPPPALRLRLSGLINRRGIRMSLVRSPPPGTLNDLYDSPWIPLDPTLKGRLTATVGEDSNTYHTVD